MTQKKSPTLTESLEKNLEQKLEALTTHPYFLKAVSQAINLNSQRILLTRHLFERALEAVELPIRKNQEKILFQLDELKVQLSFLENKLNELPGQNKVMNLERESSNLHSDINPAPSIKKSAKPTSNNPESLQIL